MLDRLFDLHIDIRKALLLLALALVFAIKTFAGTEGTKQEAGRTDAARAAQEEEEFKFPLPGCAVYFGNIYGGPGRFYSTEDLTILGQIGMEKWDVRYKDGKRHPIHKFNVLTKPCREVRPMIEKAIEEWRLLKGLKRRPE